MLSGPVTNYPMEHCPSLGTLDPLCLVRCHPRNRCSIYLNEKHWHSECLYQRNEFFSLTDPGQYFRVSPVFWPLCVSHAIFPSLPPSSPNICKSKRILLWNHQWNNCWIYLKRRISRLLSTIFLFDWPNFCFRSATSVPSLRCFFRERTSFGLMSIKICSVHNSDSKLLNSGLIALKKRQKKLRVKLKCQRKAIEESLVCVETYSAIWA